MYKVVLCLLFSFFTFPSFGTTIVPFQNLGIMASNSQAVVLVEVTAKNNRMEGTFFREYSTLQILESLQPGLEQGSFLEIKNLHKWNDYLECMIWGDLTLEAGETYLLFLQQNEKGDWQPLMLSYGALHMVKKAGVELLVPFDLGAETHLLKTASGLLAEPLVVYDKKALLDHLRKVILGEENWDQEKVKSDTPFQNDLLQERAAPSHCTYLGAPAPYPRWNNFPTALPTYYTTGGDPGCASSITKIQGALSDLNTNYSGLNLTDGGTHNFTPDCSSGANGSQFTNFVDNNYGQRSITIQFDDPCSEIADLSGCSGTLAVGGLYWFFATHTWDGMDWNNGAYGYVLVNNGVGACYCASGSDYDLMMTHELTHTLGIGHIAPGEGVANMNPSCCNNIQTLDIECLDYFSRIFGLTSIR